MCLDSDSGFDEFATKRLTFAILTPIQIDHDMTFRIIVLKLIVQKVAFLSNKLLLNVITALACELLFKLPEEPLTWFDTIKVTRPKADDDRRILKLSFF